MIQNSASFLLRTGLFLTSLFCDTSEILGFYQGFPFLTGNKVCFFVCSGLWVYGKPCSTVSSNISRCLQGNVASVSGLSFLGSPSSQILASQYYTFLLTLFIKMEILIKYFAILSQLSLERSFRQNIQFTITVDGILCLYLRIPNTQNIIQLYTHTHTLFFFLRASQVALVVKNLPANARDMKDET